MKQGDLFFAPCGLAYQYDPKGDVDKPYLLRTSYLHYSERYDKYVMLEMGMRSDGATYAWDIISLGWWVHDKLCNTGKWADGTKLTNWQCSMVLSDILWDEGRYIRSQRWKYATFLLGGGEARKNGMWRLKSE